MEIIVLRTRIAGALPHYIYRALVSAEAVATERRRVSGIVTGPQIAGRLHCVRIAPLLAPERYFEMGHVERSTLAPRIGRVARRIETLIIRTLFPEMTADSVPIVFELEHDPGDSCAWANIDDLTASFDHIEPRIEILTAFDLGLRQGDGSRAA